MSCQSPQRVGSELLYCLEQPWKRKYFSVFHKWGRLTLNRNCSDIWFVISTDFTLLRFWIIGKWGFGSWINPALVVSNVHQQQISTVQTMCKHLWHCSTLNILLLNLENINIQHYILNSEDIFLPLRCPAMHVVSWSVRLVWNQVS